MKTKNSQLALAVLLNLRNGDEEALKELGKISYLPATLISLSDLARHLLSDQEVPAGPHLDGEQEAHDFVGAKISKERSAEIALHIAVCMHCRGHILVQMGINPLDEATRMLGQALESID